MSDKSSAKFKNLNFHNGAG